MFRMTTGIMLALTAIFSARAPLMAAPPTKVERTIDVQVRLAWAHASPGTIDGRQGKNTRSALEAFQRMRGLNITGKPDEATLAVLKEDQTKPTLIDYEIVDDDVQGPFVDKIPSSLVDMADLERLSYTSPREAIAEKFGMNEPLLKRLNPGKDFSSVGTTIRVADGRTGKLEAKVARIEVDKADETVRAYDEGNRLLAVYPATIGSDGTPSPSGSLKVNSDSEESDLLV